MSLIAVIPARGGSKGVPHKNIREINGIPLMGYSIKAAEKTKLFDKIVVSTDSKEIGEVAVNLGAEVPFIRPSELSGDFASSDSVVAHAINFYKENGCEFDIVCKLQPTSPLRTSEHILEAYHLLKSKKADFVVSFCECEHSPLWCDVLQEDGSIDNFMKNIDKGAVRQELPTYYRLNGAIYMGKTERFLENGSFIGKNGYAYIMSQSDSVDIDNELDFEIAQMLLRKRTII